METVLIKNNLIKTKCSKWNCAYKKLHKGLKFDNIF